MDGAQFDATVLEAFDGGVCSLRVAGAVPGVFTVKHRVRKGTTTGTYSELNGHDRIGGRVVDVPKPPPVYGPSNETVQRWDEIDFRNPRVDV